MRLLLVFPGGVVPVVGSLIGQGCRICSSIRQGCSLCSKVKQACRLGFVIMEATGCALLLGEVAKKSLWLVG